MAANSKHYGDVLIWIGKVIDSCETKEQLYNSRKLILMFERQYTSNLKSYWDSKGLMLNDNICDLYAKAARKIDSIRKNNTLKQTNQNEKL